MIDSETLGKLVEDIESDRVERTISTNDTDKFSKAVCAFANNLPKHSEPSYLLIGVKDNGELSGLNVTDQLLQNLAALRSDGNIQPLPALRVAKYVLDAGEIAVVEVLPSDMPPVRYKGQVWIRVGPRKAVATEQEERILIERRIAHQRTFDARPCIGSELADLSLDLFLITYRKFALAEAIIEANHRDIKVQLSSLRFFDLRSDTPNHAGILLFGADPLQWLPGAYIQFVRFAGNSLDAEVTNEKSFSGDLLSVLRELDTLLETQIESYPSPVTALQENSLASYPRVALRELLLNAVMHRSYESTAPIRFYWFSDHVEIQSPGGLYGEASEENFPKQNSYRNPIVAESMKILGFVNRYGRGVIRAQDALGKNGNPPAAFEFDPAYVGVSIGARK